MGYQNFSYFIFTLMLVISVDGQIENWSAAVNNLIRNCSPRSNDPNNQKPFLDILKQCVQRRALTFMDAVFSDDVIPLVDGVNFIRLEDPSVNATDSKSDKNKQEGRESGKTWREIVFSRFARIFRSHVLKIDIDRLTSTKNSTEEAARENNIDGLVEGRRRHHRKRQSMMPMLIMGILVMGSVLIPMGFQFLAVLGGKALILAKLALMLSSIQGLKKIATSGVNYGLYHNPASEGWHERSQQELHGQYEIPYHGYQRF